MGSDVHLTTEITHHASRFSVLDQGPIARFPTMSALSQAFRSSFIHMIDIVDDEEAVRKALGRLFRAAGYEVETFATGHEFLDSLEKQRPDCVVMDLHLPGLSGLEVQQYLAMVTPDVPVIMITGRDEPGVKERLQAAGAVAYLRKPFEAHELLEAVSAAICVRSTDGHPSEEAAPLRV
jgi:FixJ family two-component response regulator